MVKEIKVAQEAHFQVCDLKPNTNIDQIVVKAKLEYLGNVKLVLSNDHPFRSPRILSKNDQPLHDVLGKLASKRFQKRYERIFHGECLYCDHKKILGKYWSPVVSILDILTHIQKMVHIRHTIFYLDVVSDIKRKHGIPDDIPIMSFIGLEPKNN